ncbi:hypothetical protein B0O99DRAFT_685375 [Bisporella sp. PMI_857]|nr:hypothetical protein B0O99DRAFT_685375 [Bisporella sp. PMI_857]
MPALFEAFTQSQSFDNKSAYSPSSACEHLTIPTLGAHTGGASHIIQFRDTLRFTTDFEQALLMALAYSIAAEALLINEKCCFDDPRWTNVLQSSRDSPEIFTNRSELGISLLLLMIRVPAVAKRVGHVVVIQDILQDSDFDTIAADVRTGDFSNWWVLLDISIIINILASRMLFAIAPQDRALLEEEVQNLAVELKGLQGLVGENRRARFYLA